MTLVENRCHFVPDLGHVLRTHLKDCKSSACDGCYPCPERHCSMCGRTHVTVDGRGLDEVCARCLGQVREDMGIIVERSQEVLVEAIHRGVNSEAANLAGPVPPTLEAIEAHRWRQLSAFWGRIPELPEDDSHPAWVLGSWELLVREHLDQPNDEAKVLLGSSRRYLDEHLTRLAHDPTFPFGEMAQEIRGCREHLESVVRDSRRRQQGAPCPMCGAAKLELWHDERRVAGHRCVKCQAAVGADSQADHCPTCWCRVAPEPIWFSDPEYDVWWCRACRVEYAPADYRSKVDTLAPLLADRLTAKQMAETYRVPERTVRHWAIVGKVKRRGTDGKGRMLYDVADVLAMRDGQDQAG